MIKQENYPASGYIVLITVLILGAVVSTIAAFLLLSGASASVASEAVEASEQAWAAGKGCAELALDAIQANPTLTTPSTGSQTLSTSPPETCSYTISGTSPNYTIATSGTVTEGSSSYVHHLNIATSQTSPNIVVSSWQETP